MARLEGAYEQINLRLNSLDHRVETLDRNLSARLEGLRESMEHRFAASDRRMTGGFFWMIGLILVSIIIPQIQHYVGR